MRQKDCREKLRLPSALIRQSPLSGYLRSMSRQSFVGAMAGDPIQNSFIAEALESVVSNFQGTCQCLEIGHGRDLGTRQDAGKSATL